MIASRSLTNFFLLGTVVIVSIAIITCLLFWCHSSAYAEVSRLAPTTANSVKAKLLFDQKEISGEYYMGDGLGSNCLLTIRPDHRFNFRETGCLGEYDRNQGRWEINGDVLQLLPEEKNKAKEYGMNIRFVPVKWGKRIYLIDENEVPSFCTAVKQDSVMMDDIHGFDYIKCTSRKSLPATGKLIIPTRYQAFYARGAVKARVIQINKNRTIVFDKGTADGMAPAIPMLSNDSEVVEAEIISSEEHRCIAKPVYLRSSVRFAKVGNLFTTGDYWDRPSGTGVLRHSTFVKQHPRKVITIRHTKLKVKQP